MAASIWMLVHASLTTTFAIIYREEMIPHCFGRWDEAMWLIATAGLFLHFSKVFGN